MQEAMEKAKVLLESLPYMREFSGQTVVIKYGGSAMTDERLKQSFALNIVLLKYIGINPVIVHGGGPQIGKMLTQLGIDSTFKQGLRVTDPETMDVVEMVLGGKVNKEIVNLVNQSGGLAVGLSGKDGRLIEAEKMEMILSRKDAPPEIIDLGRVGEVRHIRTALPDALQQRGFIPIIAPVGVDESGATYNINADDVTAAVAEALGARRMILLTDVEGVKAGDELISSLSCRDAVRAIEDEQIQGGMIPKVKCCMEALECGVQKTHIIDGRVENSILLEMFTNAGIGTEIVP
jgi:acetylglutamate kinase